MATLRSFFVLLLFQGLGLGLRTLLHLPLPGPVLGMVLLAGWLLWRDKLSPSMMETSSGLLSWLGLLFVPAGVGIVTELALLRSAWFSVTVALIGSTLLTLLVTAGVMAFYPAKWRRDGSR